LGVLKAFTYLAVRLPPDPARSAAKYVSGQMGHGSIQATANVYGHLIPGDDIAGMDGIRETTPPQSANPRKRSQLISLV